MRATRTAAPASHSSSRRSGMILVAAMLCVLLATALSGNIVRSIMQRHGDVRDAGIHLQAEWLSEAGLQRGLAAVRADPNYEGETWTIPEADLPPDASAVVTIRVDRADRATVLVRTTYSVAGLQRVMIEQSTPVTDRELEEQ